MLLTSIAAAAAAAITIAIAAANCSYPSGRREHFRAVHADCQAAKHALVRANMRLVIAVAKRFARAGGVPLSDLVQEGALGLMRAVEKYDPARGFKFATYASW